MDRRQEEQLRALFRQDWPVSAGAGRGLERSYEQIRRQCREQEEPMKKQVKRPLRLVVLAAVIAAMAVGASAITLHVDFFRTAFGTGISDNGVKMIRYTEALFVDGSASERAEVDLETAEETVGSYIMDSGESLELSDYTLTVESYLVDENGIGVLTYTLENPNGLAEPPEDVICTEGYTLYQMGFDAELWLMPEGTEPPTNGKSYWTNSEWDTKAVMSSVTYRNEEKSTETKAYLCTYFVPNRVLEPGDFIQLLFTECWPAGDQGGYCSTGELLAIRELQLTQKLPTATYEDEETGIAVQFSPLGLRMDTAGVRDYLNLSYSPEQRAARIELHYTDGSSFVLRDQAEKISNFTVLSVGGDNGGLRDHHWIAFNRLITQEVTAIDLTLEVDYATGGMNGDDGGTVIETTLVPKG